jgi:hypothetical protein
LGPLHVQLLCSAELPPELAAAKQGTAARKKGKRRQDNKRQLPKSEQGAGCLDEALIEDPAEDDMSVSTVSYDYVTSVGSLEPLLKQPTEAHGVQQTKVFSWKLQRSLKNS